MVPVMDIRAGDFGWIEPEDLQLLGTDSMVVVKFLEHTHNRGNCEEFSISESRSARDLRPTE